MDKIYLIVIGAILLGGACAWGIEFAKSSKRKEQIMGWLLQAVIKMEQEFGAGTGKLKLSMAYNLFCTTLPWLAKYVPFAKFSCYVDEALVTMRGLLETNKAIAGIVEGEGNK